MITMLSSQTAQKRGLINKGAALYEEKRICEAERKRRERKAYINGPSADSMKLKNKKKKKRCLLLKFQHCIYHIVDLQEFKTLPLTSMVNYQNNQNNYHDFFKHL